MWSGSQASIPSGWYLCDGNNSTPDLRNKFVIGAGSGGNYSVGDTGGYTDTFIPEHTHTYSGSVSGGTHNHTYIDQYVVINNGYRPWPASNNDCAARNVNVGGDGSHSHSYSGTTAVNTGGAAITNAQRSGRNLPPYYALCYIMKS